MSYLKHMVVLPTEEAAAFLENLARHIRQVDINICISTDEGATGDEPVVRLESQGQGKWLLTGLVDVLMMDIEDKR